MMARQELGKELDGHGMAVGIAIHFRDVGGGKAGYDGIGVLKSSLPSIAATSSRPVRLQLHLPRRAAGAGHGSNRWEVHYD